MFDEQKYLNSHRMPLRTYLFGGSWQAQMLSGKWPGLFKVSKKYFRERWWKAGYNYFAFINPYINWHNFKLQPTFPPKENK